MPRVHDPGFDFRQDHEISLFFKVIGPAIRPTLTPIQCLPEIKRPGPEFDHYVLLVARLRKNGRLSPPPIRLHEVQRDVNPFTVKQSRQQDCCDLYMKAIRTTETSRTTCPTHRTWIFRKVLFTPKIFNIRLHGIQHFVNLFFLLRQKLANDNPLLYKSILFMQGMFPFMCLVEYYQNTQLSPSTVIVRGKGKRGSNEVSTCNYGLHMRIHTTLLAF